MRGGALELRSFRRLFARKDANANMQRDSGLAWISPSLRPLARWRCPTDAPRPHLARTESLGQQ